MPGKRRRDLSKLTRLCHSCGETYPAYCLSKKNIERTASCPSCKADRIPSQVQLRMVWGVYAMIRRIALSYANKVGVEPAQTEDHGTLVATRAAMRFSRLRTPKTKFSSYAYACISIGISRWCRDDGAGAISLRVRSLANPVDWIGNHDDAPRTIHFNGLDCLAKPIGDSHVPLTEHREMIDIIQSKLTAEEFQLCEDYAQGDIDPNDSRLNEALAKARLAVIQCQ